jgi:membrane-bound lytic murein transglycosylase B
MSRDVKTETSGLRVNLRLETQPSGTIVASVIEFPDCYVEAATREEAIEGDLGFQGLQNEFDNVHLPHKKPKGKELSEQQKQENQEFSRQRVACEHAHAGIKRYRSVTDVYRNRVPDFDDRLMLNAVGLWNLYLDVA